MARIPVIIGGKISGIGQSRATNDASPRVFANYRKGADGWVRDGDWAKVKSSNVAAVRYEKHAKKLWVKFKNNTTYYYPGMDTRTAKRFFRGQMAPQGSFGKSIWKIRKMGFVGIGPI